MVPAKITLEKLSLCPFLFVFGCYFLSLMLLQSNSSFLSASLSTLDGREPKNTGASSLWLAFIQGFWLRGEKKRGGEKSPSSRGEKGSADRAAVLAMGRLETGEVLAFASTQLFASECEGRAHLRRGLWMKGFPSPAGQKDSLFRG